MLKYSVAAAVVGLCIEGARRLGVFGTLEIVVGDDDTDLKITYGLLYNCATWDDSRDERHTIYSMLPIEFYNSGRLIQKHWSYYS
jgi:hypothetical protein